MIVELLLKNGFIFFCNPFLKTGTLPGPIPGQTLRDGDITGPGDIPGIDLQKRGHYRERSETGTLPGPIPGTLLGLILGTETVTVPDNGRSGPPNIRANTILYTVYIYM